MFNGYGYPYYNAVPDQLAQLKTPNAGCMPTWVQGEAGAKSYLVAPNTTVLLMDSESERFFIKTADASGMPLPLRVFEYHETAQNRPTNDFSFDPTNYVTREEFEELRANLPVCNCKKKTKEVKDDE